MLLVKACRKTDRLFVDGIKILDDRSETVLAKVSCRISIYKIQMKVLFLLDGEQIECLT